MNLPEFRAWLDGFIAAAGDCPSFEHLEKIRSKLATVAPPAGTDRPEVIARPAWFGDPNATAPSAPCGGFVRGASGFAPAMNYAALPSDELLLAWSTFPTKSSYGEEG